MRELLAVRDGEGSRRARAHAASCPRCRSEIDRLHRLRVALRALGGRLPQRDLWPGIVSKRRRRRVRRTTALGVAGLVLAASLAGVVIAPTPGDPDVEVRTPENLDPVIARSQELESVLRVYAPDRRVVDAPTALALSVLEERLSVIDEALLESERLERNSSLVDRLWRERVDALEALVGLRLARDGR